MTEPRLPFAGRVALVTGAGRGAGRAISLALAERGARLAANDITPVNVEPLVDEICAAGGSARAYIHDVAKKVDVQAMINNLVDDYGRIDLLVNNANVRVPTSLINVDEWDLHRVFEVNVIGALLVMQSVARIMRTQEGGLIVNLTRTGIQPPATFAASRLGLAAMTEAANLEMREHDIRVFSLADENPLDALLEICRQAWR